MSKKKLLMVAGAGGSLPFGMPSVAAVHGILDRATQNEYPLHSDIEQNLYVWVYQEILNYWRDVMPRHSVKTPNFEDVLYAIYGMSTAFPSGYYSSPFGALIARRQYPHHLWWWREQRESNDFTFNELGCFLADEIVNDFRRRCLELHNTHAQQLADLANFLAVIRQEFDIAVVTVNYDDILYRNLQPIVTGFDLRGAFHDDLLLHRDAWPCIVHLHGSVHFDMRITGGRLHEIFWEDKLTAQFQQNSRGRSNQQTPEGMEFPMSAIVAGYGKTTQILRRPFRTYYSELDRLSLDSDAVLFLGYGFNDEHVNGAFERYRDARRRRVVLVDFADDNAMTANAADWHGDSTAGRALGVFNTRGDVMAWLGNRSPGQVGDLKQALEFDRSTDQNSPLSIWYNGTADALQNPQRILNELM